MNYSGRLVVVDIGSEETKLLDVEVSGGKLRLLHAERMVDMVPFIEDGQLVNLAQFAASLKDTLKARDIRCKRLVLSSSILGIQSDIMTKTLDVPKVLDAQFKADLAETDADTEVADIQRYGPLITSSERMYYTVKASVGLYIVQSLIEALEELGLTVLNVVDPLSPIFNLIQLYPSSFDIQNRVIINIGNTTTLYLFVKDIPFNLRTDKHSFQEVVDGLMQISGQPALKVKAALNRVGLLKDPQREDSLRELGINPEDYYACVEEFCEGLRKGIYAGLGYFTKTLKYHPSSIILTGGYADMAGLAEYLAPTQQVSVNTLNTMDYVFTPFCINFRYRSTTTRITNKCNTDVGALFAPALGVVLGGTAGKNMSLRPKRRRLAVYQTPLVRVCVLVTLVLLAVTGKYGTDILKMQQELKRLDNVNTETAKLLPARAQLKTEVDSRRLYLENLENVDTLLQPLASFVRSSTSATFVIASVDTSDMLLTPEMLIDPNLQFLQADEDVLQPEGELIAPDAEQIMKTPIIIRGYALSTSEISRFYSGLQDLAFAKGIDLVGQVRMELPSEEKMYFFEIEVQRADKDASAESLTTVLGNVDTTESAITQPAGETPVIEEASTPESSEVTDDLGDLDDY